MSLPVNYQDDILDTSQNTHRIYNIVDENDNVVEQNIHLVENTQYTQRGSTFGAQDINNTNGKVNELDTDVTNVKQVQTFNVATSAWGNNTDTSTNSSYPFKATISTTLYTANSSPIWTMIGNGGVSSVPSKEELDEGAKVMVAMFTASSIILYATEKPSVALKLLVKGV